MILNGPLMALKVPWDHYGLLNYFITLLLLYVDHKLQFKNILENENIVIDI